MFAGDYADACADGAAVGFCAYALIFEPVVFGAGIIAQERRRLVHVDDVEPTVAIVIAYADAHAALRSAILVESAADLRDYFREGAILIVAIEAAGDGVAGHVNVGPAVVVEVGGRDAKTVRAHGRPLIVDASGLYPAARNRDAGAIGNIFKGSVATIAVQEGGAAKQSLRIAAVWYTAISAVL